MPLTVLYNIVCDVCGSIANDSWLDSGLECYRWAHSHGWGLGPNNEFRCLECNPRTLEDQLELEGEPPGFEKPALWCGKCKTGKCKKCKEANREREVSTK